MRAKCGDLKFKLYNKLSDEKLAVSFFKCQHCYHNMLMVLTTWRFWTNSTVCSMKSKIPSRKIREDEIANIPCNCKGGKYQSLHVIENDSVAAHVLRCAGCDKKMLIFYEKLYDVPYRHLRTMADKVTDLVPELVLVSCASAFEVYCRYVFEHHSALTKSMIEKRKLNLQDLESIKDAFLNGFGIDIVHLDPEKWEIITGIFRKRHLIVHNGGFDKEGTIIRSSRTEAINALETVDYVVELVEKEFVKDGNDRNGAAKKR